MKVNEVLIFESDKTNEYYQIARYINEMCQPYLTEIDFSPEHNILFRGMKKVPEIISVEKTRKDRRPTATPQAIHELSDNYFYEKFGIKPRSEGTFATRSYGQAKGFGVPAVIFPVGEFKYVWSPKVADMYGIWRQVQFEQITRLYSEGKKGAAQDIVNQILDARGFRTDGLPLAMSNQVEISIICDEYLVLNEHAFSAMVKLNVFEDVLYNK